MIQTILASKAFALAKKYWQVAFGALVVFGGFVFKLFYDKNKRAEGANKVLDTLEKQTVETKVKVLQKSKEVASALQNNDLPDSFDALRKLSAKKTLVSKTRKK